MKNLIKNLISIAVLSLFMGCAGNNISFPSISKAKLENPVVASSIFKMPRDASRVVLAISSKILDSHKNSKDVILQSTYQTNLVDIKMFVFQRAILLSYKNDANYKRISADVYFTDSIGRILAYTINASYTIKGAKIIVDSYTVSNKYINAKNSVCFILPANKYLGLRSQDIPKTFYGLYEYAAINAVTPDEAMRYSKKSKWVVMIFIMTRTSKSATLTIGVSTKVGRYDKGYTDGTRYMNYEGWKVGIVAANFKLLKPDAMEHIYAKAIFTPGAESKKNILFRKPKVIGLYKIL